MNNNEQFNENYFRWRDVHTKIFGSIFSEAFSESPESQIALTAALMNIANRDPEGAIEKLKSLRGVAEGNSDDTATLNYFIGLSYEMLGEESEMNECYTALLSSDTKFYYPIMFHPYYRAAKNAQRAAECTKSERYYKKALSFYDGLELDEDVKASVSQILYELATLNLYMHSYDNSDNLLKLSEQYDPRVNFQRSYVKAVLCALLEREDEMNEALKGVHPDIKPHCLKTVDLIRSHREMHYFEVEQDRSTHPLFWEKLKSKKESLEKLIAEDRISEVESYISELLTEAFPFVNNALSCKIEASDGSLTVYCKCSREKTLRAEEEALFAIKPTEFSEWRFISVDEYEKY